MTNDQRLFAADRETLSALGAAALQDEAAILGGHANQETVRLAAAARIRLKRALALHHSLLRPEARRGRLLDG